MSLEKILLDLGIEKAKDTEEIQSRVAEGISVFLEKCEPVLSTFQIRKAIVALAHKGKAPVLGKKCWPAWSFGERFANAGANKFIMQYATDYKWMKINDAVRMIFADDHPKSKIQVSGFFEKPQPPREYIKNYVQGLVYFKKEEDFVKYIMDRLLKPAPGGDAPMVIYALKIDESWRV